MQSGRRLYIGRLSQDATRSEVETYFGTHGKIVDVRLMAGFCFLEYEELKVSEIFASRRRPRRDSKRFQVQFANVTHPRRFFPGR